MTKKDRVTTQEELEAMGALQMHLLELFGLTGRRVSKLVVTMSMDQINLEVEEFIRGEDLQAKNYTYGKKNYTFIEVVG